MQRRLRVTSQPMKTDILLKISHSFQHHVNRLTDDGWKKWKMAAGHDDSVSFLNSGGEALQMRYTLNLDLTAIFDSVPAINSRQCGVDESAQRCTSRCAAAA